MSAARTYRVTTTPYVRVIPSGDAARYVIDGALAIEFDPYMARAFARALLDAADRMDPTGKALAPWVRA